MAKKKKQKYVDNKLLAKELMKWKKKLIKYDDKKDLCQHISPKLAKMFMKIVDHVAFMSCFRDYTYIDDMKAQALYFLCCYGHNFDIRKSTNAFSYCTQFVYNAFLQTINSEKLFTDFKQELIDESIDEKGIQQEIDDNQLEKISDEIFYERNEYDKFDVIDLKDIFEKEDDEIS